MMLPSHTVENYLKAIFLAQIALGRADALVPMGQLASALGVVPGTATTMVKALAESGLVRYEPYAGVRLTAAGEKLAALVLRRHRLIELFLVKVMGMSWTEVHDEAEHLEHAVSGSPDRSHRRDARPAGSRSARRSDSRTRRARSSRPTVRHAADLPARHAGARSAASAIRTASSCGSSSATSSSRAESSQVEERDAAADSVRLRGGGDREFTIGARAASKVLVQVARDARPAAAARRLSARADVSSSASRPSRTDEPFGITDNSFLVEEAFNQERGHLSEHLQRRAIGRALGADVHAGVAGRLADAQFSYTWRALDGGTRRRVRRHADQLPLSGADRRAGTAGLLAPSRA